MNHSTRTPANCKGIERDVNDLFRGFFAGALPATAPAIDILESPQGYEVTVDVPGVSMDTIELSFVDKTLRLKVDSETPTVDATEESTWHRRGRQPVTLDESIRFPKPVDAEKIDAALEQGVLRVTLPMTEAVQPRTIQIRG